MLARGAAEERLPLWRAALRGSARAHCSAAICLLVVVYRVVGRYLFRVVTKPYKLHEYIHTYG